MAGARRSVSGEASGRRTSIGLSSTVALAAGLLLAGGAFGLSSLILPGVALLLLVAGTWSWVALAAHGARVAHSDGPSTVVEGEPYPVRIQVRGGLLPPRGELVDPLGRSIPISITGRSGVRIGFGRAEASIDAEARFEARGRRRLDPARMVIADPLGLCCREVSGAEGADVLVLPRVEPVQTGGGKSGADGDAAADNGDRGGSGIGGAAGAEIDGLRPYRPGSPASRIHWRSVARHGDLIERQLTSGEGGISLVVLDAERPVDSSALDRAARAAASLCMHLARAGGCMLVAGSGRALRIDRQLRGWPQARARLALVEPGESPGSAAIHAARAGMTFWISASADARPPRGLVPGSFLVTPDAEEDARRVFTVAGCGGLRLDSTRASRRGARRAA